MYYHASRVARGYNMSSSPGGDTFSLFFIFYFLLLI